MSKYRRAPYDNHNILPGYVTESPTLNVFKNRLKDMILNDCFYSKDCFLSELEDWKKVKRNIILFILILMK